MGFSRLNFRVMISDHICQAGDRHGKPCKLFVFEASLSILVVLAFLVGTKWRAKYQFFPYAQMCSSFYPSTHHSHPPQFTSNNPLTLFGSIGPLFISFATPIKLFFCICHVILSSTTCIPCPSYSHMFSVAEFNTTSTFMHCSQAIIYLGGNLVPNFAMFSSFFNIHMDCIHRHHRCFPFGFIASLFLPSYFICASN